MSDAILQKIQKLLALSNDKGATEAEAATAAEFVQRLLQDNGLTMAQVEAKGGNTDEVGGKREKRTTDRRAMYAYQRTLMGTLAANNFCLHTIMQVRNAKPLYSGGRGLTSRCHVLIGRFINVQATEQMYDYLETTMRRLASEAGIDYRKTRDFNFFLEGATSRVVERLHEQRRTREREQRAAATAKPTAQGNGSGTELVLTDVYGSEADLNQDMAHGWPAGTTAASRIKRQGEDEKRKAVEAKFIADGVDEIEAFYRSYGYDEADAKRYANDWKKKSARSGRRSSWTNADEKNFLKTSSPAYRAGREAGATIGLDTQVAATSRKLLD